MKALKFTLIAAVLLVAFSSCTKQDLNEDDVLQDESVPTLFTGGEVTER
ncbi:hypothetical protein [Seonamhaeicola maritimus]|nr:hypothetical protein [Seonamhaeicola maritimus]